MAKLSTQYRFYAEPERRDSKSAHEDSPKVAEPYIANPALIKAVNLAIYLGRPLLLEGEAGCGKTRLASAVAYELGLPLYRWDVRSTSKAKDGLYNYDAVLRLHDVQAQNVQPGMKRQPSDPTGYRNWGALGDAFRVDDRPAVVLIDEIDKADLDFPNDLLAVLDEPWAFEVIETGETGDDKIKAAHVPIVIITSNKEKGDLPEPFLRRCIYYYVKFPNSQGQLQKIVDAHYEAKAAAPVVERKTEPPSETLFRAASERFLELRQNGGLFKNPGTSEFLDWLEALQGFGESPYAATALKKEDAAIPYPELLFKRRSDWVRYAAL